MPLDAVPQVPVADMVPLSRAALGEEVVIRKVLTDPPGGGHGEVGLRLLELGFVEGEVLRIVAHGFPGREPLAVRVGNTTFALRRFEADYVLVTPAARNGRRA